MKRFREEIEKVKNGVPSYKRHRKFNVETEDVVLTDEAVHPSPQDLLLNLWLEKSYQKEKIHLFLKNADSMLIERILEEAFFMEYSDFLKDIFPQMSTEEMKLLWKERSQKILDWNPKLYYPFGEPGKDICKITKSWRQNSYLVISFYKVIGKETTSEWNDVHSYIGNDYPLFHEQVHEIPTGTLLSTSSSQTYSDFDPGRCSFMKAILYPYYNCPEDVKSSKLSYDFHYSQHNFYILQYFWFAQQWKNHWIRFLQDILQEKDSQNKKDELRYFCRIHYTIPKMILQPNDNGFCNDITNMAPSFWEQNQEIMITTQVLSPRYRTFPSDPTALYPSLPVTLLCDVRTKDTNGKIIQLNNCFEDAAHTIM